MEYISTPKINFNNSIGNIDKKEWFNDIIDYINKMKFEDTLLVYDFGKDGNVKVWMTIDEDNDLRIETDIWRNPKDGDDEQVEFVDREYISVMDISEIINTLERLWNHQFEGID